MTHDQTVVRVTFLTLLQNSSHDQSDTSTGCFFWLKQLYTCSNNTSKQHQKSWKTNFKGSQNGSQEKDFRYLWSKSLEQTKEQNSHWNTFHFTYLKSDPPFWFEQRYTSKTGNSSANLLQYKRNERLTLSGFPSCKQSPLICYDCVAEV